MSKTWLHQKRYESKKYWRESANRSEPVHLKISAHGIIVKSYPPEPKDLNEPRTRDLYRYPVCNNYSNAKWWQKWSNRKARHKVRELIKKGRYTEAKHLKPENIDWHIW